MSDVCHCGNKLTETEPLESNEKDHQDYQDHQNDEEIRDTRDNPHCGCDHNYFNSISQCKTGGYRRNSCGNRAGQIRTCTG